MEWEWENVVGFEPKATKNLQSEPYWMIGNDGEVCGGSFNLSGSNYGNVSSSAKSLISPSMDSYSKGTRNMESNLSSGEPLIGLKLGKRTYFENTSNGSNIRTTSFPVMPPFPSALKKTKPAVENFVTPRCLVEGCNTDLSTAKVYHRKHRVCESHSKSPIVIVAGLERRFCQQCSRFHGLDEFDEKKRSCRRRLSDHNARRRKPQQGTVQFNPAAQFYEGRGQTGFLPNIAPHVPSTNPSKFSVTRTTATTREHPFKSSGDELAGMKLQHLYSMKDSLFLSSRQDELNPATGGKKGSPVIPSHIDGGAIAAPQYTRALSLLSNNPILHQHHSSSLNGNGAIYEMNQHSFPWEYWPRIQSLGGAKSYNYHQEMEVLRTQQPYDLYSNIFN